MGLQEHGTCNKRRCGDLEEEQSIEKWTRITRGNKITKSFVPYYVHLSHANAKLAEFSAYPGPPSSEDKTKTTTKTSNQNKYQSKFKLKAERRCQETFTKYIAKMKDEGIINLYITKAKYEPTSIEKQDFKDARRITIDAAHTSNHQAKSKPELLQQGKNIGYAFATTVRKLVPKFTHNNQQVRFKHKPTVARSHKKEKPIMITYD